MKYCTHCGAEIVDEAVICVHCGCATNDTKPTAKSHSNNTLLTVAKVFMIISCVEYPALGLLYAFFLLVGMQVGLGILMLFIFCIPLAWCLPMTLTVSRRAKNGEPISVALKVCTLLFVNTIAGILLLCANDN